MNLSEKECEALLPWYLNGTLSAEEKLAVDQRLSSSAILRNQLDQLSALRDNLPKEKSDFPAAELGWRRLQKQIRAEKKQSLFAREIFAQKNWSKVIAIAAMLVATVQVGLFALLNQPYQHSDVRLLGGQGVVVEAHQAILQLQLAPQTSWQEVVDMLNQLNADIVQGPSALGLIRIRLVLNEEDPSAKSIEEIINELKASSFVQHVSLEK